MHTYKTSKSKENILRRIRQQLGQSSLPQPYPEVDKNKPKTVFSPADQNAEEDFAQQFIALGGKFVYCQTKTELSEKLKALFDSRGWDSISCPQTELHPYLSQAQIPVQTYFPSHQDEGVEACLTDCELLIARTGTIVFSSSQREGRTSSIFPPVLLVIARANQLIEDLSGSIQALKKKYPKSLPSMVNFTTGPSRTADIEKTLVVGVHGPGEVICFFLDA